MTSMNKKYYLPGVYAFPDIVLLVFVVTVIPKNLEIGVNEVLVMIDRQNKCKHRKM